MADRESETKESPTGSGGQISTEAKAVMGAVLILEREHLHLERPRVRKELTDLIKDHVR